MAIDWFSSVEDSASLTLIRPNPWAGGLNGRLVFRAVFSVRVENG
jgi:hypothetical protein